MDGSYFLCSRSEINDLVMAADKESSQLLLELKYFLRGNIDIQVYPVEHAMGYSIAGDLTVNGGICRSYDPVDLCFLDLNELMLKKLIEVRNKR